MYARSMAPCSNVLFCTRSECLNHTLQQDRHRHCERSPVVIPWCNILLLRTHYRPLVIGDMPFGSYTSTSKALDSAVALVQRGGVDAIKMEGGVRYRSQHCRKI